MYGIEGLLAGRTLVDRYRIDAVIGRGGMGAVYRATDLRLGRAVALKVVAAVVPDAAAHRRLRARFHREARAAAALHHPNVVAVYDFGTDPTLDLDFLVMELLRGEDLAARMARTARVPLGASVSLLHQAARGLAVGHRAGLIHRDVKPGNLYLEAGDSGDIDMQVRVLDFGIAEVAAGDEATMTHLTAWGRSPFSPAYAAPEQLRGEPRLAPATDVFSLAAVGYHLVMGERAFHSADPARMAVELATARGTLRTVRHLPRPLVELLHRALAHEAPDRPADAAAFAGALLPLLDTREAGWAEAPSAATARAAHRPRAAGPAGEGTRWLVQHPENPGRVSAPTAWLSPSREAQQTPPAPHDEGEAAVPQRRRGFWRRRHRTEPPMPLTETHAARAGAPPLPESEPPKRRGWFRRCCSAVWSFTLTTVATALFAGAWIGAAAAMAEQDDGAMLLAVALSVVFTPWAVQRILGRRGRLRRALLGSLAGTLAAVVLVGFGDRPGDLLAAAFGLQLFGCLLAGRGSGRASGPDPQAQPSARPQQTPAAS